VVSPFGPHLICEAAPAALIGQFCLGYGEALIATYQSGNARALFRPLRLGASPLLGYGQAAVSNPLGGPRMLLIFFGNGLMLIHITLAPEWVNRDEVDGTSGRHPEARKRQPP